MIGRWLRAVGHKTEDNSAEAPLIPVQNVIYDTHLLNIFITDLKLNLKFKQYLNFFSSVLPLKPRIVSPALNKKASKVRLKSDEEKDGRTQLTGGWFQ